MLVKGHRHGQGTLRCLNGDTYDGEWYVGEKQGHGVFCSAQGDTYDGKWKKDMKHGKGVLTRYDGSCFSGKWKNDCLVEFEVMCFAGGLPYGDHQEGLVTFNNDNKYFGQWDLNRPQGNGVMTY